MAKRTEKRKYTMEEVVEACTSRESDISDLEQSEAESYISDVDSVAEDMFFQGKDAVLDR